MRDHLLGYLLEALEPAEHELVERQLSTDANLRRDLAALERSLDVLGADREHLDPPPRLTQRTCQFVFLAASPTMTVPATNLPAAAAMSSPMAAAFEPASRASAPGRWTAADLVVAAGIFLAMGMLLFPAVNNSRYAARLAGCQNNLRELGLALAGYSQQNQGRFPEVETSGKLNVAGVYAAKLADTGFLSDPTKVICPASPLAATLDKFRLPRLEDLHAAQEYELAELQRLVGGSYGYTLGHHADGQYQPTKNLHRKTFAVMSDAPGCDLTHHQSTNHSGSGQNVLFEDGHVEYLQGCKRAGCRDDIFENEQGEVAAGTHPEDSVIGPSGARPILLQLPGR